MGILGTSSGTEPIVRDYLRGQIWNREEPEIGKHLLIKSNFQTNPVVANPTSVAAIDFTSFFLFRDTPCQLIDFGGVPLDLPSDPQTIYYDPVSDLDNVDGLPYNTISGDGLNLTYYTRISKSNARQQAGTRRWLVVVRIVFYAGVRVDLDNIVLPDIPSFVGQISAQITKREPRDDRLNYVHEGALYSSRATKKIAWAENTPVLVVVNQFQYLYREYIYLNAFLIDLQSFNLSIVPVVFTGYKNTYPYLEYTDYSPSSWNFL